MPSTNSVILIKIQEPCFTHLQNGNNERATTTPHTESVRITEPNQNHLAQLLAHGNSSIKWYYNGDNDDHDGQRGWNMKQEVFF